MSEFTPDEVKSVVLNARKFEGADLRDIDLRGADLIKANLSGADLRGADLREAKYNANTKWPVLPQPEGFDPEAAGAVLVGG